jgi:hypothetical protein
LRLAARPTQNIKWGGSLTPFILKMPVKTQYHGASNDPGPHNYDAA